MTVADTWDSIVGVPLNDWMRADTAEQVAWLLWLRDHPMPLPPPPPCTCPPPSIPCPQLGSRVTPMIRGRDDYDPRCPKHRRTP